MITTLIDKQDTFEIVRARITAILANETASQQALAIAGGQDPALYKLRIFEERSNPWEQYLNDATDKSPLVNVWFDNASFDMSGSNIVERQKTNGTFNVDCYGYGVSSDDPQGGHNPGDREAAYAVQRALRLVRNILMSAEYTYLGLRRTVHQRWVQSITAFQPQQDAQNVRQVVGARVSFSVVYNEVSPQIELQTLDYIHLGILRAESGEILAELDYDYTQI